MSEVQELIVFTEFTIASNQEIRYCAYPTNDQNQPATIQGSVFCTVLSGDGTYRTDPMDPLGIILVPGTTLGDTVYRVQGDSNPAEGVTRITEQITMHVISPNATKLNMKADPPMFKPTPVGTQLAESAEQTTKPQTTPPNK